MKTPYCLFVFLLFFSFYANAQDDAGIRAYAGITSAKNRVAAITPAGNNHTGFHFGADGRLNSGRMFFVVGLRYTKIDLLANSNNSYFDVESNHSIFSGRVGLGWHLIQFGPLGSIRGKALLQLDSNSSYDVSLLSSPYEDLVGATAGATVGLGVQLRFLTLDLEYEYGLVNVYSQQKETKADSFSLSLGVFF